MAFGQVSFEGVIPHGCTSREVQVVVSAEDVLQIADAIRGCQQVYEHAVSGRTAENMDEVRADARFRPTWIGHAFWHIQHPEALMPCRPHGTKVMDVSETKLIEQGQEQEKEES